MKVFQPRLLAVMLASLGISGMAFGAGLDRSGQDVGAFLQDGTYAEAVYTYIDADVSGHDNATAAAASTEEAYIKGKATGDMAPAYDFFRYGVKADINDMFSVGVLYDEPFGASVLHKGDSNFVAQGGDVAVAALTGGRVPNLVAAQGALGQFQAEIGRLRQAIVAAQAANQDTTALQAQLARVGVQATQLGAAVNVATQAQAQKDQGTSVDIHTNNITALVGVKLGESKNIQLYGGGAAQRLTGEVHLRGTAYQAASGYDAKISPNQAYGWVVGAAYAKPEIALKAALTYRSKIDHQSRISEVFAALGQAGVSTQDFQVALPESYNLDFQTGVSPTMLLTAKARYVPWRDFAIEPPTYAAVTARANGGEPLPIVNYGKDQWSAEVGLAKKLSDALVVSGNVGWDSGTGNPSTTLGPINGYYSAGLGARYSLTPAWSISAGAKYLKFGNATANLPTGMTAAKFDNNDGYIAGVKLTYHAK